MLNKPEIVIVNGDQSKGQDIKTGRDYKATGRAKWENK